MAPMPSSSPMAVLGSSRMSSILAVPTCCSPLLPLSPPSVSNADTCRLLRIERSCLPRAPNRSTISVAAVRDAMVSPSAECMMSLKSSSSTSSMLPWKSGAAPCSMFSFATSKILHAEPPSTTAYKSPFESSPFSIISQILPLAPTSNPIGSKIAAKQRFPPDAVTFRNISLYRGSKNRNRCRAPAWNFHEGPIAKSGNSPKLPCESSDAAVLQASRRKISYRE
mmetsp:Transcript_100420/g.199300  ORF Transcript_100420/g.199300 Transcript_100420/m.199300 type:complete len:224 (-) Transcript_100420:365-1036(-)